MKKVFRSAKRGTLLLLTVVMLFSLAACGKENKNYTNAPKSNSSSVSNTHTLTEEEVNSIAGYLEEAEEYTCSIASTLLKKWTTDSYFVYFFDEAMFKSSSAFSKKTDYVNVHEYRAQAKQALQEAKDLMGASRSGDAYSAAKNYYLAVNKFLSLVSEYPEETIPKFV